jgi:acyl dehydratase
VVNEVEHNMGKRLTGLAGVAALSVVLQACAWVKPTAAGAEVRLATAAEVAGCREAGSTQVSVLDKVAGVRRGYTTVSEELANLARNSAAQLGGDTVVPTSEIVDGAQSFAVYDCRRRK